MNTPTTTLAKIRAARPCGLAIGGTLGYQLLAKTLDKDYGDDTPITVAQIIESNGLDDALWCLRTIPEFDNLWRHFAVDCEERIAHSLTDGRGKTALTVARQHAIGLATVDQLIAVWDAEREWQRIRLLALCEAGEWTPVSEVTE